MNAKSIFIKEFFSSLNTLSLDYFVLGSYQSLPADTGGSDIDLVIAEEDIREFDKLLSRLAQKNGLTLASYYTNVNTKFYRLLSAHWGVQIDVFYRGLCYQGVPYYPVERLKKSVVWHNDIVRVLEEQQGFFVDYFKELIHTGVVKEKYSNAVLTAIKVDPVQCRNHIAEVYNEKIADLILQNATIDGLTSIRLQLQKELKKVVLHGGSKFAPLHAFFSNFVRLFHKAPGYVIVVEGTDGSGKSYIINAITPIMNEAFHNGIVYNHLRPNLLPDIAVLMGKRKKKKEGEKIVASDPHNGKQSGLAGSLVRWGYYMIDYTFGYMKKVWLPIHSKSKVFIFDRYYYEFYLDQKRSHVKLPNWIVRLGEMLIPKPDLILCLGGDPEKIYARKPETSLEEVKRQTQVLQDFCNKRKNAVWIDTTIEPQESIDAAMMAILDVMGKRFSVEDLK